MSPDTAAQGLLPRCTDRKSGGVTAAAVREWCARFDRLDTAERGLMRMTTRGTVLVVALLLLGPRLAWAQPVFTASQDPLAGAKVFADKGCAKCHSINGVGGKTGPDLAKISRSRTFYDLAADMWN